VGECGRKHRRETGNGRTGDEHSYQRIKLNSVEMEAKLQKGRKGEKASRRGPNAGKKGSGIHQLSQNKNQKDTTSISDHTK